MHTGRDWRAGITDIHASTAVRRLATRRFYRRIELIGGRTGARALLRGRRVHAGACARRRKRKIRGGVARRIRIRAGHGDRYAGRPRRLMVGRRRALRSSAATSIAHLRYTLAILEKRRHLLPVGQRTAADWGPASTVGTAGAGSGATGCTGTTTTTAAIRPSLLYLHVGRVVSAQHRRYVVHADRIVR